MQEHIRRGEPPGNTASAVIMALLDLPSAPVLTPEETRYLTGKLYDGYFAFEVLTKRDWDSAICGICGVCPIFESGDGNAKNCTPLVGEMVILDFIIITQCSTSQSCVIDSVAK